MLSQSHSTSKVNTHNYPLQDLFLDKNLIFDLKAKNKKEAITCLVKLLNQNYSISQQPQQFVEAFMNRENKGSTGLQNGIAIPHIKTDQTDKFYLAIGIHRQGIDFASIDNSPTQVIFLLIAPSSDANTHLNFLSNMSRLFLQKHLKDEILKIENSQKVCQFFQNLLQ